MNFMYEAYKEAKKAYKEKEIPVGAVIVQANKIISKGRNNRQKKHNVLGHAEINAIIKAAKKLKDWRLDKCELYVTLEPCDMCKEIIKECRIETVNYLLTKNIQETSKYVKTNNCFELSLNYQQLLESFFQKLRR